MTNASTLGFYYVIFQYSSERYVTCWFDGSETSELVSKGTFLKYAEVFTDVLSMRRKMEDCLHTTSIYLLDVENERITRLRPGSTIEDSSDLLKVLERNRTAQFPQQSNNIYADSLQKLKTLF